MCVVVYTCRRAIFLLSTNIDMYYHLFILRFWHSSAAYAIATELGCGDLGTVPPVGHSIYKWPHDLMKPQVSDITKCLFVSAMCVLLQRSGSSHNYC